MSTEAQKRASAKYDAENVYKITVKLNKKTDADLIQRVKASGNMQGYIKELIRKDLEA